MLDRFDAISHIMPYYANTHKTFLLLSSLWLKTRNKLDEYYDEIIELMKDNWTCIHIQSDKNLKSFFIPCDLFKIYIGFVDKEMIDTFIQFIDNLNKSKGWYFRKHYMHFNLKIMDSIKVDALLIKNLYPYVDALKSIKMRFCKTINRYYTLWSQTSSLDTIWDSKKNYFIINHFFNIYINKNKY